MSYSAFDKFKRPSKADSEHTSYKYCGLRNEEGRLSQKHLKDVYDSNLVRIEKCSRKPQWELYIQEILGNSSGTIGNQSDDDNDSAPSLSSGQSILSHFVTALVAWIEPNSIILFDEPETHLHPNAVASLFGVLSAILEEHNSFAIIATHSPIVIQEIPSKRVIEFIREGDTTTAEPLPVESFGENISELTRHIFGTISAPNYYKQTLDKLSKTHSFSEIMQLFDNNLSMNAQSFLLTRYKDVK